MKKILGIYGADGGFEFLEEGIKFGTIGRADFDRFIDQSRFELTRIFLAPLQSGESVTISHEPFDLIMNYIADIDVNAKTLAMAEALCRAANNTPILNHPAAVAKTQRHLVSDVLQGLDGLVVPTCKLVPAGSTSDLLEFIKNLEIGYPILIRPCGSQTGIGLNKFDRFAEVEAHYADNFRADAALLPHYVTEYVEHRSPDTYYRKVRYFVVDGVGYPRHGLLAEEWPVHAASRTGLLMSRADLQLAEKNFLDDPKSHQPEGLDGLFPIMAERLGLDYFGIDVNFMQDGQTLLFEANAAMNLVGAEAQLQGYGYVQPAIQAISDALNEMLATR